MPANLIVALVFIVWDIYFTFLGIWSFNADYLIGSGNYLSSFPYLPLEEILFFVCIPYSCIFTYFVFKRYFSENHFFKEFYDLIILSLIILMFLTAVLNYHKMYTFYTSFLLFITLLYVKTKKINISLNIMAYLSIVPFFFLSNGVLTGSFIESAIVDYNPNHNLGIRMFTIPIEDIFYGFLLILWNGLLYDYIKSRRYLFAK